LASLKKGDLETIFRIWQIIPLIPSVKGTGPDGPGTCVPWTGDCDLGLIPSATPADHGGKESEDESWDQVSRANRGMVGRQAGEQARGGSGRRLGVHGSCRKGWSSLRPRAVVARAGAFSYLGCSQWLQSLAMWVVGLGGCPALALLFVCAAPSSLRGHMASNSGSGLLCALCCWCMGATATATGGARDYEGTGIHPLSL
jgi:hypothetical protein